MRTTPTSAERYLVFGFSSRCRRVELRQGREFHSHNEIELLLVETGRIEMLMGGRVVSLEAGRLAVFWGVVPHAPLAIEPKTVVHRLTIPLTWFLGWKLPPAFAQAIIGGDTVIEPDESNRALDLAVFQRWHKDVQEASEKRRDLVLLECEARLRRLELATGTILRRPPGGTPSPRGLGKVEQMSRFVALHYTEHLRVATIARDAGLHPNYAAELFRKTCGISLVDYVNGHRVSHAQRLLATGDSKIVDIAYQAGFGAPSRFYDTFKKACGLTPRAYRSQMRRSCLP